MSNDRDLYSYIPKPWPAWEEEEHKDRMIFMYNEFGLEYWAEDSGYSEQEEAEAWMLWFMVNE